MRFFLTAAMCRVKLSLNWSFLAALMLFGACIGFVALAFGSQSGLKMNVGVYALSERGQELCAKLESSAGEHIAVIRYDDPARLKDDVAARKLECGYVIPDAGDNRRGEILLYVSQETLGDKAVSVLLTAIYLEDMAGEFGYKTVKNLIPRELRSGAAADISLKNTEYLNNAEYMTVEYVALKASEEAAPPNTMINALSGTAAIFSGLLTMLWCSAIVRERKILFYRRLMLTGTDPRLYLFANMAAIAALNAMFFAVPGVFLGMAGMGLLAAAAYIFCISALWTFLSMFIKSEALFLGLAVVGFLCSALLGGVFVNLGEITALKNIAGLRFAFPVYYYMRGIMGDLTAVGILASVGIVSALGVLAGRRVM